jgi:KTSC domain
MDRTPVQSSTIASVGYEEETSTLEVGFNNGTIYQYFGVPKHIYEGLMNASSKGSYLNQYVKRGGYGYTKVG